jgi:hypothetical protein
MIKRKINIKVNTCLYFSPRILEVGAARPAVYDSTTSIRHRYRLSTVHHNRRIKRKSYHAVEWTTVANRGRKKGRDERHSGPTDASPWRIKAGNPNALSEKVSTAAKENLGGNGRNPSRALRGRRRILQTRPRKR